MLEAVANAEVAEHTARRQTEALREPLALIRDTVELPDEIVAKDRRKSCLVENCVQIRS